MVHVTGEIDLSTAPDYRRELLAAARGANDLVVDLADCDLVDSVGLGVTLGAARRVRERGGSFAVIVNPRIRRTFERCRLDEILQLVDGMAALAGDELLADADLPGTANAADIAESARS